MRHRLLGEWAEVVSRYPWTVLSLAGVLTVAAIGLAVTQLRFEPDRNALISQTLDWNQRYLQWIETFDGSNDMYVVVDTYNREGDPDPAIDAQARQLVKEKLGPALSADDAIQRVVWGFDRNEVHPKTFRLESAEDFEARLQQIQQAELLLSSPTPAAFLTRLREQLQQQTAPPAPGSAPSSSTAPAELLSEDQTRFILGFMDGLTQRLNSYANQPVDLFAATTNNPQQDDWHYLRSPNDRLLLIRVTPIKQVDALDPFDHAIRRIRQILDSHRQANANISFGLTGIDVIESDETVAVTRDSTLASIVAAVLIAVLLIVAFHSVRMPMIMLAALGVAIGWAFGFTTLAIGHLQVISIVFTMILLGLGVAFAIHLASRFEQKRHDFSDDDAGMTAALRDMFQTMGPGITTGAVTTAAAFATTMFTDFRGVAEMGAIAGVGILLCLVAMFTVFAALLRIFKSSHHQSVQMNRRIVHFYEDRWIMPFVRHPGKTLLGGAVVFAASMWAVTSMRFDYDLLALLPHNLPSVTWQQKIVRDGEQSIYTGISVVDSLAEADELAKAYRKLETVDSVAGIGRLLMSDAPQRKERVRDLRQLIEQTRPRSNSRTPTPLMTQLSGMQYVLKAILATKPGGMLEPRLTQIAGSLDSLLQTHQALTPTQQKRRLQSLQSDFERWQVDLRQYLRRVLDISPITVDDLSHEALRPYFVDTDTGRKYVLEINPRIPDELDNPLDPRFLGQFVRDIESVDPNATGVIVQVFRSGELIQRAYIKAGGLALLIVFVLVWIDFRSIFDAIAALIPVAVGFAAAFAIMYLAGMSINPANIIVLPLMFGIGVDDGVHIIHRYRQNPTDRPIGLAQGTGKGISLTSYTTMIGFGSMMLASHRGIAGLGFVLTVGIAMTLLACWTLMPAYLELRQRAVERRQQRQPAPPPSAW